MKLSLRITVALLLLISLFLYVRMEGLSIQNIEFQRQIVKLEKNSKRFQDSLTRYHYIVDGFEPILVKQKNSKDYRVYIAFQCSAPYDFKLNVKLPNQTFPKDTILYPKGKESIYFDIKNEYFHGDTLEASFGTRKTGYFVETWQLKLTK